MKARKLLPVWGMTWLKRFQAKDTRRSRWNCERSAKKKKRVNDLCGTLKFHFIFESVQCCPVDCVVVRASKVHYEIEPSAQTVSYTLSIFTDFRLVVSRPLSTARTQLIDKSFQDACQELKNINGIMKFVDCSHIITLLTREIALQNGHTSVLDRTGQRLIHFNYLVRCQSHRLHKMINGCVDSVSYS